LNFVKRIPKVEQIAPVYAVIVMIIYSWALLHFFWRFPSWLFYSSLGEIAVIFAYMIVVNLLESLFVLLGFILAGMILPQRWFSERFVTRSVSLALLGLGYLIYVNQTYPSEASYPLAMYRWMLGVGAAILVIAFLIDRLGFLRNLLDALANRMVVFLYVIIPISVVSFLVVLIRNIF
jgi:hypothetical protein